MEDEEEVEEVSRVIRVNLTLHPKTETVVEPIPIPEIIVTDLSSITVREEELLEELQQEREDGEGVRMDRLKVKNEFYRDPTDLLPRSYVVYIREVEI